MYTRYGFCSICPADNGDTEKRIKEKQQALISASAAFLKNIVN